MTNSDQLIGNLVNDGIKPVPKSHPLGLFLKWLIVTLVSSSAIICFMTSRGDLQQQMVSAIYLVEITSLFLITLSTSIVAVWLCYPDLRQSPKIVWLPFLPTIFFIGVSIYRSMHPEMTVIPLPETVHGLDCSGCVTGFAVIPGFWMFHVLRRHATTYPKIAGAISFVASASIGMLVLKFVEPNDSVLHFLTYHLSPMIILAFLGALLGKKYLSW